MFERVRRHRWSALGGLVLAVGLAVLVLFVLRGGTASTQAPVDLVGSFPTTLDTGEGILHMRSSALDPGISSTVQSDFWYQPSTKRSRFEVRRNGGPPLEEAVFTGTRVRGYSAENRRAYDYSLEALRGSDEANELDPLSPNASRIVEEVDRVAEYVRNSLVQEQGRETVEGREIVIYAGAKPLAPPRDLKIEALRVDAATGLPLQRTVVREDGTRVEDILWDYEVLSLAPAEADSLFSLGIPAGYGPTSDSDLHYDPATQTQTVQEAAAGSKFRLFWLGPSLKGIPLHSVSKPQKDGSIRFEYRFPPEAPEFQASDFQVYLMDEYDATRSPEIDSTLRAAVTQPQEFARSGQVYTIGTLPDGRPTLVTERGGTTIWITQVVKPTVESLLAAGEVLVEVPK